LQTIGIVEVKSSLIQSLAIDHAQLLTKRIEPEITIVTNLVSETMEFNQCHLNLTQYLYTLSDLSFWIGHRSTQAVAKLQINTL
jgi:hypothetical protein